jgi:hypothetical protein
MKYGRGSFNNISWSISRRNDAGVGWTIGEEAKQLGYINLVINGLTLNESKG